MHCVYEGGVFIHPVIRKWWLEFVSLVKFYHEQTDCINMKQDHMAKIVKTTKHEGEVEFIIVKTQTG